MKHAMIGLLAVAGALLANDAYSANIDFEDLTVGTRYTPGDMFTSNGTTITTSNFVFADGTVFAGLFTEVDNRNLSGGSGLDMTLNNATLFFDLAPTTELTLKFGEYGGNINIGINGLFANIDDFVDINGSTLGGVSIAVTNGFGNDTGMLTLTGDITQFLIGGQELWIDDVITVAPAVPLPASVLLLGGAVAGFGLMRRRKA